MELKIGLGLVFDLIIIGALALFAYIGWKKGIIDMLGKTLYFAVVGVLTFMLKPMAVSIAGATPLPDVIGEKVSAAINDTVGSRLAGVTSITEESLKGILSDGFLPDAFADKIAKNMADGGMLSGQGASEMLAKVSEAVTDFLVAACAVIILFAVLSVAYFIAIKLLDLTAKLPVIKQANQGLGLAGGLLVALVAVVIVMWILSLAAPFSSGVSSLLDGSLTYGLYMAVFG